MLEEAIENLDERQFDTPYRDGGWTVKQVVHHVPDSHMNAYTRFKLGLTEDNPVIKPYEEGLWAGLRDVEVVPVNISITLLYALHTRWHAAIRDLSNDQWKRTVMHPEHKKR
ncbi:DinB family protein [Paraflavitalea speifideaquila]|uniref:DinB family protein n=1 Tax=Paraflavitalea speifideaquila TaxID=3076558 RepID=UPI0028ED2594|nr:DinB family protein [Paraflavitalea speifideiaquila]